MLAMCYERIGKFKLNLFPFPPLHVNICADVHVLVSVYGFRLSVVERV